MRESLLQISTRCFHTQLKASPERRPAKTGVEARKVYYSKTSPKFTNSPG